MKHNGLNHRQAFTLIELLVVISIIALLIGILLPALSHARKTAKAVKSKSDLRQLMIGYTAYQNDYNGHLMFGYPPESLFGEQLTVEFAGHVFVPPTSQRYPWRLVPYVTGVWEMMHNHQDTPELPLPTDSESDAAIKAYYLSVYPSYGLNDIYYGGDKDFGAFQKNQSNQYVPIYNEHVVFYIDEARRPSSSIIMGESQFNYATEPQQGEFRLTAPMASGQKWAIVNGEIEAQVQTAVGMPKGRYSSNTQIAFLDGHVADMSPEDLLDMRYWANKATSEDYDFVLKP